MCIFCKIIAGEIPSTKIYEDDDVYAFLDINPFSKGHTLVIPKKHYENMFDLPAEEFVKIQEAIKKIDTVYRTTLGSTGSTLLQNNGSSQDVFHYHMHLVPRYGKDGFGYIEGKNEPVSDSELETIKENI